VPVFPSRKQNFTATCCSRQSAIAKTTSTQNNFHENIHTILMKSDMILVNAQPCLLPNGSKTKKSLWVWPRAHAKRYRIITCNTKLLSTVLQLRLRTRNRNHSLRSLEIVQVQRPYHRAAEIVAHDELRLEPDHVLVVERHPLVAPVRVRAHPT